MSTGLMVLLTAILTAFGTRLIEQIFKEWTDARERKKGKERDEYLVARRLQQLVVIAEHFRHVGIHNGVSIDEYDLPDEFEGWDEFIDTGLKARRHGSKGDEL